MSGGELLARLITNEELAAAYRLAKDADSDSEAAKILGREIIRRATTKKAPKKPLT